ncbi:Arabinose efflux permease family protein [Frankia canadensis]|uniref:Arabinose efflux permease family protein n=1 Tax=Frankia canadensis TaxID=1836972 RepID=A0A2I2KTP1_9ACTN|nr:MFS transporter [Frankia canadensis]SNQ49020.1 Arabinose efflux permease family protein [Frankia canadensis]SOU56310.1 Arabinose efflux permease family protein [Frankia canadensis]
MTLQADEATPVPRTDTTPPSPPTAAAPVLIPEPAPVAVGGSTTPRPAPGDGTFAALRIRNFRLFLSGQIVSLCGTWMQTIALGWLVLSLGASGTALGLVTAAQFLPVLLFGPYGGLIADRTDRRQLLMITQTGSGLAALALGVLDLTGTARLWMVAVTAALIGLCNAVDNPARQSFVQEMVGSDVLPNAITLNSVTVNAARIVGPALAGLLILAVGTAGCFLLNAASFGAVLIALRRIDTAALHARPMTRRAPGQLREGLRYVWRTPALRVPLLMMLVIGALSYEFQVVLPLVARHTFGGTATTYSMLTSAMGAGAVAGGLLVARRRRFGVRPLGVIAAGFGIVLLAAAAAPTLPLEIAMLVLVGAASVAFISTGNATVQLAADPAMRGRVMALWSVAFLGTTPVGGPIAGWVAQTFGARAGLMLAAGAALAAAAYALSPRRSA